VVHPNAGWYFQIAQALIIGLLLSLYKLIADLPMQVPGQFSQRLVCILCAYGIRYITGCDTQLRHSIRPQPNAHWIILGTENSCFTDPVARLRSSRILLVTKLLKNSGVCFSSFEVTAKTSNKSLERFWTTIPPVLLHRVNVPMPYDFITALKVADQHLFRSQKW